MNPKEIEKLAKLAHKYRLKTLEVSEKGVKIELNEVLSTKSTPKLSKKDRETMVNEKINRNLEDLAVTDPEAYEEIIASMNIKPLGE